MKTSNYTIHPATGSYVINGEDYDGLACVRETEEAAAKYVAGKVGDPIYIYRIVLRSDGKYAVVTRTQPGTRD